MQFAFNTLQRVSPVSHGVCNVVKRIAIIFSSVLFFNQVCPDKGTLPLSYRSLYIRNPTLSTPTPQVLTQQALIGTVIAIAGTWLYTDVSSKSKPAKKAA